MTTFDFSLFSAVANIILPLLLVFQWFWDRARERSAKNGLFAVRRMVERANASSSPDVLDVIDATLATLGSRTPFEEWAKNVSDFIKKRFATEEKSTLSRLKKDPMATPSPLQVNESMGIEK